MVSDNQKMQRIGSYSETVEIDTLAGETKLPFPQVGNTLLSATIIGIEVAAGSGTEKSPKKAKTLLTRAEISTGMLHLEDTNRRIIDLPLRLFVVDGKPFLYAPIAPMKNINPQQCYAYFAEQFPTGTDKVLQISFITE